jgi:hypothetical protein
VIIAIGLYQAHLRVDTAFADVPRPDVLLGAAGLLKGVPATTHWHAYHDLATAALDAK